MLYTLEFDCNINLREEYVQVLSAEPKGLGVVDDLEIRKRVFNLIEESRLRHPPLPHDWNTGSFPSLILCFPRLRICEHAYFVVSVITVKWAF